MIIIKRAVSVVLLAGLACLPVAHVVGIWQLFVAGELAWGLYLIGITTLLVVMLAIA